MLILSQEMPISLRNLWKCLHELELYIHSFVTGNFYDIFCLNTLSFYSNNIMDDKIIPSRRGSEAFKEIIFDN